MRNALFCSAVFSLVMLSGGVCPAPVRAEPPARKRTSEERALTLLQEMVAAYALLPSYEQHTEFLSVAIPFLPPSSPFGTPAPPTEEPLEADAPKDPPAEDGTPARKKPRLEKTGRLVTMTYQSPNLLRLEMEEKGNQEDANGILKHVWVSDGKVFWSDDPTQKLYAKEAAPKTLNGFPQLASLNLTTLELIMLAGNNPFQKIKEEMDAVRDLGSATLHGVETEIVLLKSHDSTNETEVRLFIGKGDRLLRRVVMDTIPIPAPLGIGKIGDPLDELIDQQDAPLPQPVSRTDDSGDLPILESPAAAPPSAIGTLPMKTRLVYDNRIEVHSAFAPNLFQFVPPENYSLFIGKESLREPKKQKPKKYRLIHKRGRFLDVPILMPK